MTTETMSPETAVIGATYWWHEVGTSTQLQWAPWVNRQTAVVAGAKKDLVWGRRIDLINEHLGCADLDRIAEVTGGEIQLSEDATGRGGKLTLAGVMAAVELAEQRAVAPKVERKSIGPDTVECLECGAVYPAEQAHLVDAGGMGCRKCNH